MQVPREGLVAKLAKLTVSQQSIESVASFCIFYAKDARGVVQIWDSEFYKAPEDRRMALLYLANHILQEGRKKGSAFQDEFYKVLPQAVTTMRASGNDKTRKSLTRLVTVWEERRVFGSRYIKSFKEALGSGSGSGGRSDVGGSGGGGGSHRGAQGPVASALSQVQQAVEASAAANSNYASAWNQDVVNSQSLQELNNASSLVKDLLGALQAELLARRQAEAALQQELAEQAARITAAGAQLATLQQQQAAVEQRTAAVASSMAGALGSLQHNGAPGSQAGSPQAPAMDDEDEDAAGLVGLNQSNVQPPAAFAPAGAQQPLLPQPAPLGMFPPPGQGMPPPGMDFQSLLASGMLAQALQQVTGAGPAGAGAPPFPGMGGLPPFPGMPPGAPPMGAAPAYEQQLYNPEADQPYDPECPD